MSVDRIHPFRREGLLRRTAPFAVALVLPFVVLPITENGEADLRLIAVAAVITALVMLAAPLVPWGARPRADAALLPLAYLAAVAVLREGHPEAASNYAILAILPVFWSALYGSRLELAAVIAAAIALLVLPVAIPGESDQPPQEWHTALLAAAVATAAGIAALRVVATARSAATRERESRAFLRAVMDSAAEGFVVIDPAGTIEWVNPSAANMLGWDRKELRDRNYSECVQPERSEDMFRRKNGSRFPVQYSRRAIRWGEGPSSTVVTFADITHRREVERMKDEFVSVVGHELRTPLTSIRGSLGLMQGGAFGEVSDEAAEMLDMAVSNTDRLVRLLNDILDLERIESGRAPVARESCDLADLVHQAVELLRPAGDAAGVALEETVRPSQLEADPDRVIQTLTNLIGNAIKFSDAGSPVEVSVGPVDGEVVVQVRDHGRGIPAEKQSQIFERFAQVDASDSREKGGTGLGLAIARTIVEQHGGRIWVESEPGEGSTFSFALPADS